MRRLTIRRRMTKILLIGLVTLTACGEAFDVTYSPDGECWDTDKALTLTATVTTPSVRPELLINLDQDYPFTNLQLRMVATSPSGEEDVYDFQTTVLTSTGDWLIEQAEGGYQVIIALADEFETTEGGEYTFSLRHNMRENQVCGLRSVGLRLPKQ